MTHGQLLGVLVVLCVLVAAVAGSPGGDGPAGGAGGPESGAPAIYRPPPPIPDSRRAAVVWERCDEAPAALVTHIERRLTVAGGGRLYRAAMVKSKDLDDVYLVSAGVRGRGLDRDDVGTWAVGGSLEQPEFTVAVDAVAQELSDWAPGDAIDAGVGWQADGVEQTRLCVRFGR